MKLHRILLFLVVLLTFVLSKKKKPDPKPKPEPVTPDTPIEKKDIVYKFTVTRAMLEGIYRGYYRQPRYELDERCLGQDTISAL